MPIFYPWIRIRVWVPIHLEADADPGSALQRWRIYIT